MRAPMDTFTLIWLILGGVLMFLELLVPGLVIIFFGVAALLVGGAAYLGLVSSWPVALGLWAAGSSALVFGVRGGVKRLSPGREERSSTDEELDAFGERVEVVEAVGPDLIGRIRFRGTTWKARTVEEHLEPGAYARIVTRENLVWLVEQDDEPALELASGDRPNA